MSASCIAAFFCSLFCCSHCATVGRGLIPISPIRLDSLSFSARAWCSWWSISSFTSCNGSVRRCACVKQDRSMGDTSNHARQVMVSTLKLSWATHNFTKIPKPVHSKHWGFRMWGVLCGRGVWPHTDTHSNLTNQIDCEAIGRKKLEHQLLLRYPNAATLHRFEYKCNFNTTSYTNALLCHTLTSELASAFCILSLNCFMTLSEACWAVFSSIWNAWWNCTWCWQLQ